MKDQAYLPGIETGWQPPLGRYLPPLPPGMIGSWLEANTLPGDWVIEPLCASPQPAIEAARAGRRVLAAAANPVVQFMIEMCAAAPSPDAFQPALAALSAARRGDDRIGNLIPSLYQTPCPACGQEIAAHAFLWRRGEPVPYARIIHCPHCGEDGERPLHLSDLDRLRLTGSDALHRSRALDRVCRSDDPQRADVEEALQTYLPRPLFVLMTLINRLEGLGLPVESMRLLQALLLTVCDEGCALWRTPDASSRPRQLTTPPQFRENNLWLALEEAITTWSSSAAPVPVTWYPEQPPETGGICLLPARLRSIEVLPEGIHPAAVITAFPRPNQAFWTLSVLWAGWLWGRETAQPLKAAIARRRFDWDWHSMALHTALNSLPALLPGIPAQTPFFGLAAEITPGFLAAIISAMQAAGFNLHGLALRSTDDPVQFFWLPGCPHPGSPAVDSFETASKKAAVGYLQQRAEPSGYLHLYAAALQALAAEALLPCSLDHFPTTLFSNVQAGVAKALADPASLQRLQTTAKDVEAGWYWLTAPPAELPALPLSDRVEMALVTLLQRHTGITRYEIAREMGLQFPGLFTPDAELMDAVLQSYGEEIPGQPGRWRLGRQEAAAGRREEIDSLRQLLAEMGGRMGFTMQGQNPFTWMRGAEVVYHFHLMASSIISRYVLSPQSEPPAKRVLVLPGSRARLLSFKLRRDLYQAQQAAGVHILKFRHLRRIAAEERLTLDRFINLLDTDPPFWEEATQLRLDMA